MLHKFYHLAAFCDNTYMRIHVRGVSNNLLTKQDLLDKFLSNSEKNIICELSDPVATDWLAGRISVKSAVLQMVNLPLQLSRLEIGYFDSGQPYIEHDDKTVSQANHISISHRDGIGVSAASDRLVGVDVEMVQRRDKSMLSYISSSKEREVTNQYFADPNKYVTFLWVIKEAVMKADGCGLSIPPASVSIQSVLLYNEQYRVRVSAPLPISHWCVDVLMITEDVFCAVAQPHHEKTENINWNITL